jgi:hypothetical protein
VDDNLARELAAIELRLSRMVAAPTHLWNTELLDKDARALLAKAQTTAERDAVTVTIQKIDRFSAIGQRFANGTNVAPAAANGIAPGGVPNSADGAAVGAPGSAAATGTDATAPGGGRFDAIGVLRPVVSKRPGAPQFALVDERGQVISFVSPTPDVNLQPYLGHRVGVVGNRGFIPEFQRARVTAGRVQPLGERILR